MVRFDYSGHGESGGSFTDGTIGRWLEESLAVFAAFCRGPQVVIGSSMGGWLALLLARELGRRQSPAAAGIAGLVLVAPAVDFTEELMWKRFPAEVKRELADKGVWARPSAYGEEPYLITRGLIEEARNHLLLGEMIETGCPVRILQGVGDAGRALAARGRTHRPLRPRRRRAHLGQGRRSPAVSSGRYRAAHCRRSRVLIGHGAGCCERQVGPYSPWMT